VRRRCGEHCGDGGAGEAEDREGEETRARRGHAFSRDNFRIGDDTSRTLTIRQQPAKSLYTVAMLLKTSPSKLLGIVAIGVLLLGGVSIAWFQTGGKGLKRQSNRTSEKSRMRAPLIQGRVATEADFHSGAAVFHVPDGRSVPYSLGRDLPIRAELVKSEGTDWPVGSQVSIVQAEISDGKDVILGVVHGDEQGICTLEDVKLLE